MKRIFSLMIITIFSLTLISCSGAAVPASREKLTVAVAIVPQAEFVRRVAGDLVNVVTLIPPGNSPANYQPTAMQMQQLSNAAAYFTLELPTEEANILPKLPDMSEGVLVVDVRHVVEEEFSAVHSEHHHGDHVHEGTDPHIWLSPRRAAAMVQNIAEVLSSLDENNSSVYQKNANEYIDELTALDAEISGELMALEQRSFIIYHSAYAYFADDYDLDMHTIEVDGKQATAADLSSVIDFARDNQIKVIFYQQEFDANQAQTVADEIGGVVAEVAPLSEDYTGSLRDVVKALKSAGEER